MALLVRKGGLRMKLRGRVHLLVMRREGHSVAAVQEDRQLLLQVSQAVRSTPQMNVSVLLTANRVTGHTQRLSLTLLIAS